MADDPFFLTVDPAGNPLVLDGNGKVLLRSPSQGEYENLAGICPTQEPNPLQVELTSLATSSPAQDPHAPATFNPWLARGIGLLQVTGGLLEIGGAVGLLVLPEPTSKVGGVILILHGVDTLVAGARSLYGGLPADTATKQLASAGARSLGAGDTVSEVVGVGTDLVAGMGPSVAVSITRRAAITAATESPQIGARLSLGLARTTQEVGSVEIPFGHAAVGIQRGAGAVVWLDAALGPGADTALQVGRQIGPLARKGYAVTTIAVAAEDVERATIVANTLALRMRQQKVLWQLLGPNCATFAGDLLRAGRIAVPYGAQFTPYTLYLGVRSGYTITAAGSGAAVTASEIGDFLTKRY